MAFKQAYPVTNVEGLQISLEQKDEKADMDNVITSQNNPKFYPVVGSEEGVSTGSENSSAYDNIVTAVGKGKEDVLKSDFVYSTIGMPDDVKLETPISAGSLHLGSGHNTSVDLKDDAGVPSAPTASLTKVPLEIVPSNIACEKQNGEDEGRFNGAPEASQYSQHLDKDWDNTDGWWGRYARFTTGHYYFVTASILCVCIAMAIFVMYGPADTRCTPGSTKGQMTVCEATQWDWSLPFQNSSLFKDAIDYAQEFTKDSFSLATGRKTGEQSERSLAAQDNSITFLYEHEDGRDSTIFTPAKIQAMCKLEALVTQHPLYSVFCQLADNGKCVPKQSLSPVTYFYPVEDDRIPAKGGCKLLGKKFVDDVAATLMKDFLTTRNGFFVNEATKEGGYTNATRSLIQLGQPLAGYATGDDEKQEQSIIYRMFMSGFTCPFKMNAGSKYKGPNLCTGFKDGEEVKGLEQVLFENFEMTGFPSSGNFKYAFKSPYSSKTPIILLDKEEGNLKARFYGLQFQSIEFARVVTGDLNFAIISIVAVYLYMWFHTKSAFISAFSMLQIVLSLPVGYFFYFNVFQYHFYQQIHILTIFLALGVGADSVFVLVDAWKEACNIRSIKTSAGRMHYALARTASSCFNTTFTTVMSFVSTSITGILPIHCFAVFAAIVMSINYLLVISLTPAIIMIYNVHFSDLGGCCCYCTKKWKWCKWKETVIQDVGEMRKADKLFECCGVCKVQRQDLPAPMAMAAAAVTGVVVTPFDADGKPVNANTGLIQATVSYDTEEKTVAKMDRVAAFFYTKWAPFLGCKEPFRRIKLGALLVVACLLAYFIGMIYCASKLTPPRSEELWFPKSHMMNANLFDRLTNGWKGAAATMYMDAAIVFGIKRMDRNGYNWFFPSLNRGVVEWDTSFDLRQKDQQRFFIKACDKILAQECKTEPCKGGTLMRPGEKPLCVVRDLLNYWNNFYQGGAGKADGQEDSEIPADKLMNVYKSFLTDATPFSNSTAALIYHQNMYQEVIGEKDGKITFALIKFKMSVDKNGLSNRKGHLLYDVMKDMTDKIRSEAPPGMLSMFFIDLERVGAGFTWMDVEDALVANLFQGFAICFPVCFGVLIFATGNVILAFYATFTIVMIVVGVLGAVQAYHGWDLGIAESIAGVIVIGFSVDYTVHLGHMYREASFLSTREERTRFMVTYMGGTVIGGGMTTLIAGLVLFLCTLQFFTKMATLLVWTIGLSMVHSLLFFVAVCALIGPTSNLGDVSVLVDCVKAKFRK